tara:strand:- start:2241 stop:3173 length:933 start_codon:yes stop_codon:yes gene_type:complete
MQDNYNNPRVSLMNLNTPLFSSGGSPMAFPKITESAYGAWSTYDIYGTGNDVIRLRNSSSTPTERDFTATELTDGTYSSWYSSGTTFVTKMYDQKSSNDLYHPASGSQPKYSSSDNTVEHFQPSQYTKSNLFTNTSTDIANTFDGNEIDSVTTLVMSAKKIGGTLGFSDVNAFGLFEGFSPTAYINRGHRAIVIGGGSFTAKVGVSMRTETPSYVLFEQFENNMSSSLTTYTGLFTRRPVSGSTVTDLDLYENATQEIDSNTTTLGTGINADKFVFGDSTAFRASTVMAFNKELTATEHSELHSILSANY